MREYFFVNMARGDLKPDGAVVGSFYYDDSTNKKEYLKNAARMKKAAGSSADGEKPSRKKRTVKVSKSVKKKYRDKNRVEGYLQYNSWEYVLRVPITSVDHQTTWTKFKQRYNYKHKDHPLQYVMVKGDGELYGAISNAPVEGDKIPLVNVEHSVVSAFDNSMIKQMTALALQYEYKGKEHSYTSANGLNKKKFKYIELGNVWEVKAPEGALKTKGQFSTTFSSGTPEENMSRFKQYADAVSRGDEERAEQIMENESVRKQLIADIEKMLKYNNFRGIAASVAGGTENLEITEPVTIMYEGKNRIVVGAKYKGQTVFAKADFETILDRVPMLYIIMNWKTGLVYYVGLSKEPLIRFCDHFGYNHYPPSNRDRFFRTAQEKGWDLNEFRMVFVPSAGFFDDEGKFVKSELQSSYNVDSPENLQYLSYKGAYVDKLARGDEAVLQWLFYENEDFRTKYLYIAENGLPFYWANKDAKDEAERLAKEHLKRWEEYPIEKTMKLLAGENEDAKKVFWKVPKVFFMLHCRNVMLGVYDVDSPVFHEIVQKQADFLHLQGFNADLFIENVKKQITQPEQNNKLECGEVGRQIGRGTWSEDGKTVTRSFCYAVNGCIGKMQPTEYPCFNGKECKCYDLVQEPTVFSDEPEQL